MKRTQTFYVLFVIFKNQNLYVIIKVKESTSLPIVAIGGINEGNLREVKSTGVDSVCIVSAITMAEDPEVAASKLVSIWDS